MAKCKDLELVGVIGFDGQAVEGMKCHPDGIHVLYPLGNKVTILNFDTRQMIFLSEHTNIVAAIAISPKGTFVGSGQINHIGFKSLCCLWDFNKRRLVASHDLHKVRVEAIVFNCDETLMISIGGRDCGQVILWDTVINSPIASVTASRTTSGDAVTISSLNKRPCVFMTGGDGTLRVWTFNPIKKAISSHDITLGKLKRLVICMTIKRDDSVAFCGTSTGDILKVALGFDPHTDSPEPLHLPKMLDCIAKCGIWKKHAPIPEVVCYKSGVRCILILEDDSLVVGAGDGRVDVIREIKFQKPFGKGRLSTPTSPMLEVIKSYKFPSAVTSIELKDFPDAKGRMDKCLLVGTAFCEIFSVSLKTFEVKLLLTSHSGSSNAVAFPRNMSDVFATGGVGDVRVWALHTRTELLRITVPNFVCTCLLFAGDGKSIITGWNDGCIRAFTPLTGRLMYCILNCHNKGTSAIALTRDGKKLISGGCSGQVRIWNITPEKQSLSAVLKEHKCPISAIKINNTGTEAVSAATDGSCIVWDILKLCRRQILLANTVFMCACYHPSGCQILTAGTDRRVAYWEAGTGNLAREVEASRNSAVNAIDINHSGELFVTGGNDEKIKLWKYQDGIYTHVSPSGIVTDVKFSPDGKYFVNTSASGSIFVWKTPQEYLEAPSGSGDADTAMGKKKKDSSRTAKSGSSGSKGENISVMDTSRNGVITSVGTGKKGGEEKCVCPCDKSSGSTTQRSNN